MAQTKLERVANIEKEIRELLDRKKLLLQQHKDQERKDRTHRLCERGGYLESVIPELPTLTEEQFKTFVEKTLLTDFARRTLATLTGQIGGAPAAPEVKPKEP